MTHRCVVKDAKIGTIFFHEPLYNDVSCCGVIRWKESSSFMKSVDYLE